MGRLSADRALTKRYPVSRQAIWEAIRKTRGAPFTLAGLAAATRQRHDTIRTYVTGLTKAGYIAVTASIPKSFTLVSDEGVEAPRVTRNGEKVTQGAAREQMWRTMKIVGQFTSAQLAIQASLPASPVSEIDAKDYCKRLSAAGYLAVAAPAKRGKTGGLTVFRFVAARNTGPLPPMVQRLKTVFDPNIGQIVWSEAPRT